MTRLDRRALFATGSAAALLSAAGISSAETPARGGHLRIALAANSEDGLFDMAVRYTLFDCLVEIAPDGTLRGELATRWKGRERGRVWDFELRENITFHDGNAFGPEDVVTTLESHPAVENVEVTGTASVCITLHAPDPDFPLTLADPEWRIRAAADPKTEALNGTGAYEVKRYREGRELIARRVRPHYKDGDAAWFDSVELICIPDANVRAEAVRDGYVDIAVIDDALHVAKRADVDVIQTAESLLAIRDGVARPRRVGGRHPLDDARLVERWWMRG